MDKFFVFVGIAVFGFIFALFAPIVAALFGAFSGWVVSLVFDNSIKNVLTAFGANVANIELWQVGATLGFIGGFFRSRTRTEKM